MIALVVDQVIGIGLVTFFGGFVIADLTRPAQAAFKGAAGEAAVKPEHVAALVVLSGIVGWKLADFSARRKVRRYHDIESDELTVLPSTGSVAVLSRELARDKQFLDEIEEAIQRSRDRTPPIQPSAEDGGKQAEGMET